MDASTQIEPEDGLFQFDVEVGPILEVLVGKTLEQSLQEVWEEAELEDLKLKKKELLGAKSVEAERVKKMEALEVERWEAKEKLRLQERARVEREAVVSRKVGARSTAASLLRGMGGAMLDGMERDGLFVHPTRRMVEDEFMAWLVPQAAEACTRVAVARRVAGGLVESARAASEAAAAARREAAAAKAAAEAVFEAACERKAMLAGVINIFIKRADGEEEQKVGPIEVLRGETIAEVEAKIAQWLETEAPDFTGVAPTNVLGLAYNGKAFSPEEMQVNLLDAHIPDNADLTIAPPRAPTPESEGEEGGDGEGGEGGDGEGSKVAEDA